MLVSLTWLSIPLSGLPSSFPIAFHKLLLSCPINKVSIVSFLPWLFYMWNPCSNLNKWLETRYCATWMHKFVPKLNRERRNWCWTCRGDAFVFLVFIIWGIFLYVVKNWINGIVSNLGDGKGWSLGGGVVTDFFVCTLRGCKTGYTIGSSSVMLLISGGWIFLFWLCGGIGGNGKFCTCGLDVLTWNLWLILLIAFFVVSP